MALVLLVPKVAIGATITFNDGVHGQPASYTNSILTVTSLSPSGLNRIILDRVGPGDLILENSWDNFSPYLFHAAVVWCRTASAGVVWLAQHQK